MHHLPENLDKLFQEWLSRNVNQDKLTTWTGRSLLKLAFQAGFELRDVAEGRKRSAMERQHADYPGGSADYAPRAYLRPGIPLSRRSRPSRRAKPPRKPCGSRALTSRRPPGPATPRPIRTECRRMTPDSTGFRATSGRASRKRGFPAIGAEIPPPPGNSGPRGPMETRFDYIDTVWAEYDQG